MSVTVAQEHPAYKPKENELKFIEVIHEDEKVGKVPAGVAAMVDCAVLRKLHGVSPLISASAREHLNTRSREFDIGITF